MIKAKKTQLSTDHQFLTNQAHLESEIREHSYAKKSQETKVRDRKDKKSLGNPKTIHA
jgi:hypothetical protein